MKACNQVKAGGPCFHGRVLPLYSLYGEVNGKLYVCTRLWPRADKYYSIQLWNGFRWEDSSTKEYSDIRKAMSMFMHSSDFIREKCIPQNSGRKKRQKFECFKKDVLSCAPKERKVSMYTVRPGSQARIDGRGYNISEEENVRFEPALTGMSVNYGENKPTIIQYGKFMTSGSFDGLLDGVHKDHMKVKQTKIRPDKTKKLGKINVKKISPSGEVAVYTV